MGEVGGIPLLRFCQGFEARGLSPRQPKDSLAVLPTGHAMMTPALKEGAGVRGITGDHLSFQGGTPPVFRCPLLAAIQAVLPTPLHE